MHLTLFVIFLKKLEFIQVQIEVASKIHLYWGSGSPYACKVQIVLEEKELQYESHFLKFSNQERKTLVVKFQF